MTLQPFREGKKWGYKDGARIVVAPQFDSAGSFSEGLARVKVNGKWGFVDSAGQMVIEPVFDQARLFQGGYAKVQQGKVWGYIDTHGLFVEQLDAGAYVDKAGDFISEKDYKNWGKPPHSKE